jgi:hypothetical protein
MIGGQLCPLAIIYSRRLLSGWSPRLQPPFLVAAPYMQPSPSNVPKPSRAEIAMIVLAVSIFALACLTALVAVLTM